MGFFFAIWSNTFIFQGPVGSLIEVEVEIRDSTEHPPTDAALSPQQQAGFYNDSPVTSQPPISPPPTDINVVDENASASIPTLYDIRIIKHRNPVEALIKL